MQKENHCKQKNEIEFIGGQRGTRIIGVRFKIEYSAEIKKILSYQKQSIWV